MKKVRAELSIHWLSAIEFEVDWAGVCKSLGHGRLKLSEINGVKGLLEEGANGKKLSNQSSWIIICELRPKEAKRAEAQQIVREQDQHTKLNIQETYANHFWKPSNPFTALPP